MAGTFTATSNNSGCRVLGFVSVGDGTRDSGGGNVMCDAYVGGARLNRVVLCGEKFGLISLAA
jgi:hypothetical protein